MSSKHQGSQLTEQLTADLTAGSISATLIAPVITIIDRTVAEQSSSKKPLLQALSTNTLSSLFKPKQFYFSRPFLIVWTLYASTYTVANTTDTILGHRSLTTDDNENAITKAAVAMSFLPTYIVNISLGILKDVKFAQYYSSSSSSSSSHSPTSIGAAALKPATIPAPLTATTTTTTTTPPMITKIPKMAYTIFLLRDSITIASSFTLAPWLATATTLLDPISTNPHVKSTIAQLAVPAAFQFLATPLHLLALDMVGRAAGEEGGGGSTALQRIRRDWLSASSVRAARVLPAFGVGCLVNTELREWLMMVYGKGVGDILVI